MGNIDKEFDVSKEEFRNNAKEASDIWNNALAKTLIKEDTNAQLKVNLVYDERQSLVTSIDSTEQELVNDREQIISQTQEHEKKVEELNNKLTALNNEIKEWNDKGGAPENVYEDLLSRQQKIKNEIHEINTNAQKLNSKTDSFNAQVNELNNNVDTFNDLLTIKPEGGIFDPNRMEIDVYIFGSKEELVHVLAHEFGHALGVEHNKHPNSIMYFTASNTNAVTTADLNNLEEICKPRHKLEFVKEITKQQFQ